MYGYELCRRYKQALGRLDLPATLELFVPDATVRAPISGQMGVREFHERLFARGRAAIARLVNVFDSLSDPSTVALHFSYTWMLRDGGLLQLDGVSIFDLAQSSRKFERLTIIYDPSVLRSHVTEREIETLALA